MPEAYRDLTFDQAMQRRDEIEERRWDIMDLLEANRAEAAQISQYIAKLIREGLRDA